MTTRFRSIVTESDFSQYADPSFKNNKVAEAPTIAANSWAWNDTYKAAHVNDVSVKGSFSIPIGFLKMGDVITLSCEFMNVSGVKGKIAVDGIPTGNAFTFQSEKSGSFEYLETSFIIQEDKSYNALFGIFTADVGEYYVRNCTIKIDSKYDDRHVEWFSATLQNDWTGDLLCARFPNGMCAIKGELTAGVVTGLTIIAGIPAGYIPDYGMHVPTYLTNGNQSEGLILNESGLLRVYNSSSLSTGQKLRFNVVYVGK